MKKIIKYLSCVTLIVIIWSTSLYACNFHNFLPTGDGSEVIDTKYIEYTAKTPDFIDYEEEYIDTYIYIIEMEDFLWVENAVGYMSGLYVIGNEEIDNIFQDMSDENYIQIMLTNGEIIKIDTINQHNNEDNVLYVDEDEQGLFVDVREEYLYIYEESEATVVSNNQQEDINNNQVDIYTEDEYNGVETDKDTINNENQEVTINKDNFNGIFLNIFVSLAVAVVAFLIIKQIRK